jgi:hypothetical protein
MGNKTYLRKNKGFLKCRNSGLLLILVNFLAPGSGSAFPWYGSRSRRPNSMRIRIHNTGCCIPTGLYRSLPTSTFDSRYMFIFQSFIAFWQLNFESSFFRILLTNVLFAMHARKLPRLNSEPYRVRPYIQSYFCLRNILIYELCLFSFSFLFPSFLLWTIPDTASLFYGCSFCRKIMTVTTKTSSEHSIASATGNLTATYRYRPVRIFFTFLPFKKSLLGVRIFRIRIFLGLQEPNPLVRGPTDPDPSLFS